VYTLACCLDSVCLTVCSSQSDSADGVHTGLCKARLPFQYCTACTFLLMRKSTWVSCRCEVFLNLLPAGLSMIMQQQLHCSFLPPPPVVPHPGVVVSWSMQGNIL
jgi:hypothetical protein